MKKLAVDSEAVPVPVACSVERDLGVSILVTWGVAQTRLVPYLAETVTLEDDVEIDLIEPPGEHARWASVEA